MNNDDSRHNSDSDKSRPASKPDDPQDSVPGGRREPVFTDFDEDEDYEEADRDTDYASTYEEEAEDDEYLEPLEDEDPEDYSAEWQLLGATGTAAAAGGTSENPWDVAEKTDISEDSNRREVEEYDTEPDEDDFELADDREEYDTETEPELLEDEGDYPDELEEAAEHEEAHSWPLGLVIVGIVALLLLAAGGYGVIQQRSATQEEIRQLQASLATAANPADVVASREALREMEQRNEKLAATVDRLSLENRRLADTVTGLEKQLTTAEAAAAKPAPAPRPVAKAKPASATTGGSWFVNFGSYGQRSAAESWAKKLKPSAGEAVVAAGTRDGKTFYRVRIIGLADRTAARKVAGQLESAYKLPPLWVGSE
tara:strand:- start:334910 stop:336019 length:1110 start_codon:yes stop_codon:yes gene_type:complete